MATISAQREAFDIVRRKSFKGLAEVTTMCPKCFKVVRTHESEVNGFNEYAYTYAGKFDVSDRNKFRYFAVKLNGVGCCF